MFRRVPLSIIRSFSLYTQQWYMSYRFADSSQEISASSWFYYTNTTVELHNISSCQHIHGYANSLIAFYSNRSILCHYLQQNILRHSREVPYILARF